MSLWFLLIASSTFHVITDAHPLLSTDQLVESDSLGLWDNGDIPSEQLFGGASGSSLLLDSSDTAGYGIFTLDDSSNSNGIENDLGWLSSSSDLGLVSMDETTNFALDAEGVGGNLAENPGCTSQTRKRDESDNIILGKIIIARRPYPWALLTVSAAGAICREREENGNKEDPGKIPTPEFRSPFDVEPWTCPLDFFKMCCTGLIGPDGRALGCAYCKTTISYLSYSASILRYDVMGDG